MARGLLNKLPAVGEDECLCCMFSWSLDAVNELSEDDLAETSVVKSINTKICDLTVLPLPVARDTPSLLCPFSRYASTA